MPIKRILNFFGRGNFYTRLRNQILLSTETKQSAMSVSHKEAMKWYQIRKSAFEEVVSAILPYVDQEAVVFDVGANVGFFSRLLTEKIDFKGSMYLFEPLPHLAKLCEETFRDAPYEVHVFDYGLSDSDSEVDLFVASNGNLGWNTIVESKASDDMEKVRIQLRNFENCKPDAIPTFIKIDVEGSEYLVLRGMLDSLREWGSLPVILCEVGWGTSHPHWDEELEVFNELKTIGYSICDLGGQEIDLTTLSSTADVLLIPK
ncbi:MAG: FkbM family methyltransferase [Candidatus Poseidonia sp.]|jgi:FkbM family methyltransferase|nr:FkbM family methyltransferase [Poseidonia sp.]